MGKGTPSFGKRGSSKTHIVCRRCGRRAYNIHKKRCAACGYGATAHIREYSWNWKQSRR